MQDASVYTVASSSLAHAQYGIDCENHHDSHIFWFS